MARKKAAAASGMSTASSPPRNKRRSKTDRILQRLSLLVLLWAVATPFLADAQDGGRKDIQDVGQALANSVCETYMNVTIESNPECFSSVEMTSTGWLIAVWEGNAAISAREETWARCPSFIVLPGGNTWHRATQGFLFLLALVFSFLGIAIISDMFMAAIETITATTKTLPDGTEEDVWNPTVANLTLMALGSSAPEILLNVVGIVTALDEAADPLGPSTIVGSASFNLLIISAVCVLAPMPDIRKVQQVSVFIVTAAFSIWAYLWLLIILQVSSPGVIEIWEALVTLAQFPILVFVAYGQDVRWKLWGYGVSNTVEPIDGEEVTPMVDDYHAAHKHNYSEYRRQGAKALAGAKREHFETAEEADAKAEQDADDEFDLRGRSSDPYCKVMIGDQEKRTRWLSKKLHPKWNEKMIFDVEAKTASEVTVKFECFDHDELSSDDFLGTAELNLASVTKGMGEQHVLQLQWPNQPMKECGNLKVAVQILGDNEEVAGESLSILVTVIQANDLLAMDSPNKFLDMMASQLGRSLKRLETGKKWTLLKVAYGRQFRESVHPGGEGDELTTTDCVMHFLTIFWKVLFATVPPPHLAGGWLAFVVCLCYIGALTAVVGELAGMFGCVAGVSKSMTAITFVALGTSLPDTFASKVAAVQEDTADASLGNITGSNSVNVFLGIGLPWTIASVYWKMKCNMAFPAGGQGFVEGVIVFSCCALVCLAVLAIRRKLVGGELGGTNKFLSYGSSSLFVCLWLAYIGLAAYFEAYPMFEPPNIKIRSIANGCGGPVSVP